MRLSSCDWHRMFESFGARYACCTYVSEEICISEYLGYASWQTCIWKIRGKHALIGFRTASLIYHGCHCMCYSCRSKEPDPAPWAVGTLNVSFVKLGIWPHLFWLVWIVNFRRSFLLALFVLSSSSLLIFACFTFSLEKPWSRSHCFRSKAKSKAVKSLQACFVPGMHHSYSHVQRKILRECDIGHTLTVTKTRDTTSTYTQPV